MGRQLSVLIPAYNEARRLPPYLASIRLYLDRVLRGRYQVVVVDDGSQDELRQFLHHLAPGWPELRVVVLVYNQGKGAALRRGLREADAAFVLLADADGATPIDEEARLRGVLEGGADIAVGCRRGCRRPTLRYLSGIAFSTAVRAFFDTTVRDTQCGFKMFRRTVAQRVFEDSRENGYLIDVELLALARRLGFVTREVPVRWRDVPGSKVCVWRDGWRMLSGLFSLHERMRRVTGFALSNQRSRARHLSGVPT